ncbi:MAG: hypothetical protein F9K40_04800 [Kofleriaceae bacterium]|nr:MAG: hypothetical protein F9K40_04800 [Kofleriaceae bacterium]MBZ0231846.1 hypothetical protein [Kofleriaceae bacterium]
MNSIASILVRRSILFAVLALVALSGSALAEDRAGPPGSGVQIRVPTGWKTSETAKDGESFLISLSPDGEASVMYGVAEAANLQKAVKSLDAFLGKLVTGAKMSKAKKLSLNGMSALAAKGTGKLQSGVAVQLAVVIAQTPTGKVLFVIGLVNAAKKNAYKKTLDEVLAGVRPAS